MIVQQRDNEHKGEFFVEQEGERLAEMTYSWAGTDKFIIDHIHFIKYSIVVIFNYIFTYLFCLFSHCFRD